MRIFAIQTMAAVLIILVGSMFFFAKTAISQILAGAAFLLAGGVGWMLVKFVKIETREKDELSITSKRLAIVNEQIRKLDSAKSEFISIASHQLRTPLTAIKGFVSLLMEGTYGKLGTRQQEALAKVYASNERLANLVEDLLNISRIESGRMEFRFQLWKIEDICRETADAFVFRAREKKLKLEYKAPKEPLPEILVDGAKVREVISNLMDNAIKYTLKGGVILRSELVNGGKKQSENDGQFIRITVSDTGIGIPADEIPHLFTKFFRGKNTSRISAGGTGLGLYVGKSIIKSNGGKIWAESHGINRGSKFFIELPVKQEKNLKHRE